MNVLIEKTGSETPRLPGLITTGIVAVAAGLLIGQLQLAGSTFIGLLVAGTIAAVAYAALDPWRGLVLLLISTQFSGISFNSGQFTFRPDELVFIFVMLIWVMLFLMGKCRLHSTILDIPLTGLVIIGFISSYLYSYDASYSYRSIILQMLYMAMYFFTANVLLDNRDKIDRTILLMMVIAGLHALYSLFALAAFMGGINLRGISSTHLETLSIPSTAGFFPEANTLGAFATMMLALFLTHLVTRGGTGIMKTSYLVAGVVLLFGISLTSLTRSAWVGMLLILAVMPFYSRPKGNAFNPRAIGVIAVILISVGLIVFPAVNQVFSAASGQSNALINRFENIVNTDSGSFEGRVLRQEIAYEQWKEKPIIGYGVLSMRVGKLSTRGWLFSTMLQSLHDTGLVGGFFMLWFHLAPVIYALWAATKTSDKMRRASLVGLCLGAIAMAISSQLSSFVWLGFPWIFMGILVATAKDTLMLSKADTVRKAA